MNSILNSVLENLGNEGLEKIGGRVGLDRETTGSLMKQMGPVILAKMGRNVESPQELSSLDTALSKDHDGSVFNHIDELANPNINTKGDKIMNHIFGEGTSAITSAIAQKAGISSDSAGGLLEIMGPLVLGQLGKMKSESSRFDITTLQDILTTEKNTAEKDDTNVFISLAKNFLDKDNDGSITDDLFDIAKGFLK